MHCYQSAFDATIIVEQFSECNNTLKNQIKESPVRSAEKECSPDSKSESNEWDEECDEEEWDTEKCE